MSDNEPFPGSPDDMMDTIAALRARVAKLEAALRRCRQGWHNLEELYGVDPDAPIAEIDAVLKDATQ